MRCLFYVPLCLCFCTCFLLGINEQRMLYYERVSNEASESVKEQPCHLRVSLTDYHGYGAEGLVHLSACQLRGTDFSNVTDGLEELERFWENLPVEPIQGVWFRVHVKEFNDDDGWVPVESANGLRSVFLRAGEVKIGDFRLSGELTDALDEIPATKVKLTQDPRYEYADNGGGLWAGPPAVLTSRNMKVDHDVLYSSLHPGDPNNGDIQMYFTVGDPEHVSVLAENKYGTLRPWKSQQWAVGLLFRVEAGAVSAREMMVRESQKRQFMWSTLLMYAGINWLAVAMQGGCNDETIYIDESLLISLVATGVSIMSAIIGFHFPAAFAIGSVSIAVFLVVANTRPGVRASDAAEYRRGNPMAQPFVREPPGIVHLHPRVNTSLLHLANVALIGIVAGLAVTVVLAYWPGQEGTIMKYAGAMFSCVVSGIKAALKVFGEVLSEILPYILL